MSARAGEVLSVAWEGTVDELYVRGHVTPAAARDALEAYYGDSYVFGEPSPGWARWCCEGDVGERFLRTYSEKRRGRFPIMVAEVTR